jgi:hypothetical protein
VSRFKQYQRYCKDDINSWPKNTKRCKTCLNILLLKNFNKETHGILGHANHCKSCKNSTDRFFVRPTEDEINSWGLGNRKCVECNKIKPFKDFHRHKNCMWGVNTICKQCRKIKGKKDWENQKINNLEKIILNRAKSRANKNKIDFNLTIEDIVIPEKCPIFQKSFIYGHHDWAPSIDRIISKKGYIKGNIIIISNKANIIKNNATAEEILKVGNFYNEIDSYIIDHNAVSSDN